MAALTHFGSKNSQIFLSTIVDLSAQELKKKKKNAPHEIERKTSDVFYKILPCRQKLVQSQQNNIRTMLENDDEANVLFPTLNRFLRIHRMRHLIY